MAVRCAAGETDRPTRASEVHRRLLALYGHHPSPVVPPDPLDSLVETILSQNTSDANSSRAFADLRRAFPDWRDVVVAPVTDVEAAIRTGGLARVKAPRIQALLSRLIERHGDPSLGYLRELDTPAARRELEAITGVGPKTAGCVLLFALGRPVIPVDTHVHRVARRIGLAPADATPEEAETALEAIFAPDWSRDVHINLITHGRRICVARRPRCEICPLSDICDYFAETRDATRRGSPEHPPRQ